jgi:xylulokinase
MSLLGIDVGTTMCKAAAFNAKGECLAFSSREYPRLHPKPGWAVLDSHDVWAKTRAVISEVAAKTKDDPITALSVSSLGEAAVPFSRDRAILAESILSTDLRGSEYSDSIFREIGLEAFYSINPNLLGPQFTLPKIMWIRDNQPDLFEKVDKFLLWGDAIGYLLGGDAVENNSLANRTLLFDLFHNEWSEQLLSWSKLDRNIMGRIVSAGEIVGTVSDEMADELCLPRGVIIVAGGHDQCCNALGCGCTRAGHAVCGMGTYECITPVFWKVEDPLSMLRQRLNIQHHVLPGLYVAFLYNQAGSLVKWFRDTFASAETREGGNVYDRLTKEIPNEPTRILVLPHFDPPQWPEYIPDTSGVILGLTGATTRGDILKAIFESSTLYFSGALEALSRIGIKLDDIVASGGGARSDAWLQINADIFGIPVIRLTTTEGGLAGTAMIAGMATGIFNSVEEAAQIFVKKESVFEPDAKRHEVYHEKSRLLQQVFPSLQNILKSL